MKLKFPKEPYNFGGVVEPTWAKAKVAVLPIPYESSTSYGGGANKGPAAIIEASRHVELWDLELGKDFSKLGFFTLPELEADVRGPQAMSGRITETVSQIIKENKWPLILGGEHSITPGVVEAFKKKYKKLSVLQIDAHTDLRDEYQGSPYSHASAMKRVYDLGVPHVAVGIRAVSEEEVVFIKKSNLAKNIFYGTDVPIEKIINQLSDEVYLTFDIDGLDPTLVPGTGTPEPGGLGWQQVLDLIKAVAKKRKIVGADIVELAPIPGMPAGDFLTAKLAYKIIGYSFFGQKG